MLATKPLDEEMLRKIVEKSVELAVCEVDYGRGGRHCEGVSFEFEVGVGQRTEAHVTLGHCACTI